MRKVTLVVLVSVLGVSLLYARGRKPDDDDADNFPDYNRMEMHPKTVKTETPPPAQAEPPAQPAIKPPPSLNTPVNQAGEDDAVPKPPPAAVPVPAGASEPPLPDDLIGTLIPPVPGESSGGIQNSSSTVQSSSSPAAPQK